MKKYSLINNSLGWIVFFISAIVYILTVEPTVSWWDCGEFLTSAFKLEVGHPPGAPFFIILGRFFSLFAVGTSKVAFMVNTLSAIASAATIMFLYWTVVHLAKKLFQSDKLTLEEQVIVWGSGLVGAMAYAFSDSFWFSAAEGEVYALSSFFTAVVFWAILKWEDTADKPYANRWIVLIAYLMGLSIGVHLLNLLAIPAIVFVYYFKKYTFSWKGVLGASIVSVGILGGVQYILIPGIAKVAFGFDYFFVNSFGLPFNSGVILFIALLILSSYLGIKYTQRKKMVLWNTVILSVIVILIGYSSYALILIRASADPPMNQNEPDNAYSLLYYLNREQYGDRPLLYGQYYNAPTEGIAGEKSVYNKVDGKYVETSSTATGNTYNSKFETLFPRMYSTNSDHVRVYEEWGKVEGKKIRVTRNGESEVLIKPKFSENLRFFLKYQVGHMYLRYFMWNFSGRQNDIQGHGEFLNGNWISGIKFLDEMRLGPTDIQPESMRNDPSRNKYYMLPLIFGFIGLFYQYRQGIKGKKDFTITMLLFFFTGIAIVIYLNQTPIQPRERDYAYAGSFYAFSIWIGLAVLAFYSMVKKFANGPVVAGAITLISFILVPGIMVSQNWDDHDRSGRYMARDYAINYLESCAPNALLFTYGDNDTFPLWYVQEVEGVRPDIRIINLSYLGMDWYIEQQTRAINGAEPVKFSFTRDKYYMGIRDVVLFQERNTGALELGEAMKLIGSEDERSKVKVVSGKMLDFLPTRDFYLNVNKEDVLASGTVKPENANLIADRIDFSINNKTYISKSEWAILNIIESNGWERPIYFDHSVIYTGHVFLNDWLQFEGLAYRFVPIKTQGRNNFQGRIDTDILYDNLMNKYVWGNINSPDIYIDDYNEKEIRIIQAKYIFARLSQALLEEGKNDSAIAVLNKAIEIFPNGNIPYSFDSFPIAEQLYLTGEFDKGNEFVQIMANNCFENIDYYLAVPNRFFNAVESELNREISHLRNMVIITRNHNQTEINQELNERLEQTISMVSEKNGDVEGDG